MRAVFQIDHHQYTMTSERNRPQNVIMHIKENVRMSFIFFFSSFELLKWERKNKKRKTKKKEYHWNERRIEGM